MENFKFNVVLVLLVLTLSLTSATESWGYGTADYSPTGTINNTYYNNTYINETADLSGYWTSNGSSTATGDWDLGANKLTSGNINIPNTNSSSTGIIYKGGTQFFHNYVGSGAGATPVGYNVFIGNAGNFIVGNSATTTAQGSYNLGISEGALQTLTTGYNNLGIGFYAGQRITTGYSNVLFGYRAGRGATGSSADSNVFIGLFSGEAITTAKGNMGMGYQSLYRLTSGQYNVGLGYQSVQTETTGLRNVGVGQLALNNQNGKNNNVGVGYASGYFNNGGSQNTFLGNLAGAYSGTGTSQNANVSNGIYLGYSSRASASGNTNEIVIGYNAVGAGSNSATLGSTSTTKTILNGNVLINETLKTNSIGSMAGENITFYNSTGTGYANLNAKSFNVFSPEDKEYDGNKLSLLPESDNTLDENGKLAREYLYINEKKDNTPIVDYSNPIYETKEYEKCENIIDKEMEIIDGEIIEETYKEVCTPYEVEEIIGYETFYENATDVGAIAFNNRLLLTEVKEFIVNILNRLTGAEAKISALETENDLIKSELCKVNNTYAWCKK
jgi:hypothetical protein